MRYDAYLNLWFLSCFPLLNELMLTKFFYNLDKKKIDRKHFPDRTSFFTFCGFLSPAKDMYCSTELCEPISTKFSGYSVYRMCPKCEQIVGRSLKR